MFIETSHFSRFILQYCTDEEYRELQYHLLQYPESGKIIGGSGGIRKLRWARQGMGKSGGMRVIYYWAKALGQVYMLTIYNKSEQENIDANTLARIAKTLETMNEN